MKKIFWQIQVPVFILCIGALFSCSPVKTTSQNSDVTKLSVMFYNVENLFDIEDDPNTYDEEFTPTGKKGWTQERYDIKLLHLGKVISSADTFMPDVIGLCEIENRKVIEDLLESPYFKKNEYEIIHKDSPDGRGIDVALLYNPNKLQFEELEYIKSKLPAGDRPNTRLVLHAKAMVNSEPLHVFVNHWPSRGGGKNETEPNRLTVAYNLRQEIESVMDEEPNSNLLLMGDFNDHPEDKSINQILKAGVGPDNDLYNLMWMKSKKGEGSYNYKGKWGALDQFIVSDNLVDGSSSLSASSDDTKFVKHDWMMYVNDEGMAYPSRTYGGPNYYEGYSDHLPIYTILKLN